MDYDYKNLDLKELLSQESTPHHWTFLLLECQERPNCEGCSMKEFMDKRGLKCQAKKILALLIKLKIKPSTQLLNKWESLRNDIFL